MAAVRAQADGGGFVEGGGIHLQATGGHLYSTGDTAQIEAHTIICCKIQLQRTRAAHLVEGGGGVIRRGLLTRHRKRCAFVDDDIGWVANQVGFSK